MTYVAWMLIGFQLLTTLWAYLHGRAEYARGQHDGYNQGWLALAEYLRRKGKSKESADE